MRYPGFDEVEGIEKIAAQFLKSTSEVIKWSEKQL